MSDYFHIEVPNPFYFVRILIEWLGLKCIGMATDCIIVPIDNFQIIMAYYPLDQWFRLQNLFKIWFKCQVEKWNQTWAWTQIWGFLIEQGPRHQLLLLAKMAGFRANSEIIGKFRKLKKFYGHFVKRQKWRLQTNFWGVGVF